MSQSDLAYGAKTLVGDHNWKEAGLMETIRVLIWGRLEVFEHLGMRITIRWWRGKPYLTSIREARS